MAEEKTKACTLNVDEIKILLEHHGRNITRYNDEGNNMDVNDSSIERINYLNKRLKAFNEPEKTMTEERIEASTAPPAPAATGWGNS